MTTSGYAIGRFVQPQRRILSILLKRNDELFNSVERVFPIRDIDKSINFIGAHTGEENENTYKKITDFLSSDSFSKYLDYQMCCKEFNRIDSIVKGYEDSALLIESI